MTTVDQFSSYICENAQSISEEVVEYVVSRSQPGISEEEKSMAFSMYVKLLGFFGDSLNNKSEDFVPEHLIEWSKNNAEMQVKNGGKLSEIIIRYPLTRDIFTEILSRGSINVGLSTADTAHIIKQINRMLDVSLNETVFAFERFSEQSKQEMQRELVALSAPIVPIRDEVVVLPLIGYFDEERAHYIMETAIPKIAAMNVEYVIVDFSGVLTINRHVAESLHQIGNMLRIMGIKVVSSGMRPELVQVVINSNIEMASTYSFSTVKQALETIGQ